MRLFSAWIVVVALGCGEPPPSSSDDAGDTPPDASVAVDAGSDAGRADGGSPLEEHDVLFVGNSYTYVNDVPGHYAAHVQGLFDPVRVEEVSAGGYTLEQHAVDATSEGTELARWLRTGSAEETAFDAVVLQEQSQIGGFPIGDRARDASVEGAFALAALATARGARVILYMTWGREHGDPSLSLLGYGTYEGMQDRLDHGYVGLGALLREQGADVRLAPVGGGFRLVYEDAIRAGEDPAAEGSDFDGLYEPDGSHPSARGAYLASCIIAGTITGADVSGFGDEPELGADVSGRLRDVCARALVDPRWHVPTIHRSEAVLEGDGVAGAYFGGSVASSAEGDRVLVGAPRRFPGSSPGFARVYTRAVEGWTQEAQWLGGIAYANSVSLSSDGARALVGPPLQVWSRSGTTWAEDAGLSAAPMRADNPRELAVSGDGMRAIVAGAGEGPESVIARVLVRDESAWTEEAALEGTPLSGSSVSVDLDEGGRRAIVSGYHESPPRVFVRTDAGWVEEAALSVSGTRVALSADGTRAIVGEPDLDRAFVLVRSGGSWTEEAALARAPGHPNLGADVAISADGTRVLIGVPTDSIVGSETELGTVRVYSLREGALRLEHLLVPRPPADALFGSMFGASLAISADGRRVVVGAPFTAYPEARDYVGAAHTFTLP